MITEEEKKTRFSSAHQLRTNIWYYLQLSLDIRTTRPVGLVYVYFYSRSIRGNYMCPIPLLKVYVNN